MCDANTNPEHFKKSLWYNSRHVFNGAPGEGISTWRSNGPNGELIERMYVYVIASHSLQGKIKIMEVVEDFESKPRKAVTFLVEREEEIQDWRELKMKKKTLPGFSGGKLPGRSRAEGGREEEEVRNVENEVRNVILTKEQRVMEVAEGDVTWKAASVAKSIKARKVPLATLSLTSSGRICRREAVEIIVGLEDGGR